MTKAKSTMKLLWQAGARKENVNFVKNWTLPPRHFRTSLWGWNFLSQTVFQAVELIILTQLKFVLVALKDLLIVSKNKTDKSFSLKGCSSWFFLQKLDQTLRNIFQVRKRPFHWSLSKYHVRFWAALWFSGNYNISIIFSVGFSRIWSKFETGFNEMARNCSRDLTFRIQSLSGSGFSEKWILTILSNFLSTDKLSNFAKLQFLNDKIDKMSFFLE